MNISLSLSQLLLNKFKELVFLLLSLLLAFSYSVATAEEADWDYPLLFSNNGDSSRVYEEAVSPTVYSSGSTVNAGFNLKHAIDYQGYLLRLVNQPPDLIRMNGHFLNNKPVIGEKGYLWLIPGAYLENGKNELVLYYRETKIPTTLPAIEIYGLPDTAEVLHFEKIFGCRGVSLKAQPAADPLQLKYDVIHVELRHTISMTHSNITASMLMIGEVTDTTSSLSTVALDFNSYSGFFSVKSVDRGPGIAVAGSLPFNADYEANRLYISLPEPVPAFSRFTIRAYYSGTPYPYASGSPWGGYNCWSQGTSGTPIIFSLSEPYGARNWWPCKDLPDDKFTADLYWQCPTTYFVVSNGKLVSCADDGNGMHTFHYAESYPISSYLISVACSKYEYVYGVYTSLNHSYMTVGHYLYPEQVDSEGNSAGGTVAIMEFLARKFGEYPFLREKYVTSNFPSSGMEHQTCTGLSAGALSLDGRTVLNCHELSHQWFGDCLTMKHFDHLWLNEGFATYAEALWIEETQGTEAYHQYVNKWTTKDTYPLVSSRADEFYPYILYRKGGWVLHMLRHIMGDAKFYQGVNSYLADSSLQYGNVLSSDLQHHMETALGGDTSLNWFFDEWLYQANRPAYVYSWVQYLEGGETKIQLNIQQTQTGGNYVMPLDIKVYMTNGTSTTFKIWNTQSPSQNFTLSLGDLAAVSSLQFDPDNWVLKSSATTEVEGWDSY